MGHLLLLTLALSTSHAQQWSTVFSLPGEKKIAKNMLLASLPEVSKEFRVTFDFYPFRHLAKFSNILHMTIGGNGFVARGSEYGDIIPQVSCHKARGVQVMSAVNGKVNFGKAFKPTPAAETWTTIQVVQQLVDGKYQLSVNVGAKKNVLTLDNKDARTFNDVKVYAGSPFKPPQPGKIRNLFIETIQGDVVAFINSQTVNIPAEAWIRKGTELQTIPTLTKEFSVSFNLWLKSFGKGFRNIVQLSKGAKTSTIPSISVTQKKLNVAFPVSGRAKKLNFPVTVGQWTRVEVAQTKEGSDFLYTISIDNATVTSLVNTKPMEYSDVTVYGSNPWAVAQAGKIQDLKITTKGMEIGSSEESIPVWASWSPWSACDAPCGQGLRTRERVCSEEEGCEGQSEQEDACMEDHCAVDGVWMEWGEWSPCSVTCGEGTQWRARACTAAAHGGQACQGEDTEVTTCSLETCPECITQTWCTGGGSSSSSSSMGSSSSVAAPLGLGR